jgi:hypothetical protein
MMNEEIRLDGQHLIHLGQASTAGTSIARTLTYTKVHFEKKMGTRTTWQPRTFTNVVEMSTTINESATVMYRHR